MAMGFALRRALVVNWLYVGFMVDVEFAMHLFRPSASSATAVAPTLGMAQSFEVLGASTVTFH